MNNIKFKPVVKDRLFYDKYAYCIRFNLQEANALRLPLDHDYIDAVLQRRQMLRENSINHWLNNPSHATAIPVLRVRHKKEITQSVTENLHDLADTLIKTSADFKLVTSMSQGWVYTNDINLIETLSHKAVLKYKFYTKVEINRPKNTIKLKSSEYTHRSYFKATKLSQQQKEYLVNFLNSQSKHMRLSPSLQEWTESSWMRTQDHYFADHHGDNWLLMLALVCPDIVRKTVTIIIE